MMTNLLNRSILLALASLVLVAADARAALVAHYSFDTNYADVSGNGNGGTLVDVGTVGNSGVTTNAGEWVFGAGALNLSTERDYVSVTSRTFSSGTSPYSIAFWAKKAGGDTGAAEQMDMVIGQRDTTNFYIALNNASNGLAGLHWRSSDATTARNADFASPNDTNWHHHVITASTNTVITYYLDGSLVALASNKQTGFIIDTIGDAHTNGSLFDFNGQLDEVWIFNETITPAVVGTLYSNNVVTNVAVTSTSVVSMLYYNFENNFVDSSSSSNNGTAVGGVFITNNSPQIPVGTGALKLDGGDTSYVALSNTITFSATTPWSVAFWAQRGETGAQKGMVMGQRFTATDFIWLNDSFNGLRFRSTANQTLDFTTPKDLNLHHYALVASGTGSLSLYLDGAQSQTIISGTSFKIDSVGQAYTTTSLHYAFSGILDDVRVYSGAMDSNAVLALYQMRTSSTNTTTNTTSLVKRLHVVLQGGQSNAEGRADPAGLPAGLQSPQADIDFYYREASNTLTTLRPGTSSTSQFGPEVTTGRGYADMVVSDSSTRVAIIKYAVGGTSLFSDWKPGGNATTAGDGPYYVTFQQTVTNGLAALRAFYTGAVVTIDGMTWMQGESDDAYAATYQTNLAAFIADVRATIQTNLPFIIARLSIGQTNSSISPASLVTLRTAQAAVAAADPWSGLVDTDTFPLKSDALHFDAAGQQMLGYAFAYQLLYLQDLASRFSIAQIAAGNAEPGADADGDGASNEAEFLAGTDATNSASVLKAQLSLTGPGFFDVSYPTASGRHYAVESQSDAAGTNWTAALPLEAGTGTNSTRTVTNNAAAGFMRIRATLP